MDCPGENFVLDFVAGALPPASAEEFHAHLDGCALCQRLVGELGRAELLELPPEPERRRLPLVPRAQLDRYFILGQVGEGGMGVVYAAFDPELDRKVALKLLHGPETLGGSPETQRRWLLAEAQALARLSHPNVVTVYEARVLGDQLFLALEFADGGTLETWLRERPRSWREVLSVFLAAGEGLLAAHEAGIVHRDFKPSNVLIRRDGRVQVTDFGLARLTERTEELITGSEALGAQEPAMTTWRGSVKGTPAYMAPEQWERGRVDARTDQFSFCVALYEALYGQRPPTAGTGPIPLPRVRRVPAHVRRVLQRGLSRAPEERFPSMRELMAALARDPLTAWRVPLASVAALGLVIVGVALGAAREEPQPCQGGASRLEQAWGAARKQAVREALLSSGGDSGERNWKGVESALDGYASEWVAHYTRSCEATRVRGEQSEALLDATMQCLDRRARDLQALTDILAQARERKVREPANAARRLPALEECNAPYAQAAIQGLPAQGPMRELADSISRQLSEVRALRITWQYTLALEKLAPVRAQLRELDHAPTRAEVLLELGKNLQRRGEIRQAEEALLEAAWEGTAARHDRVVAQARILLLFIYGDSLIQPASGAAYVREAQAAVARLGGDVKMEAELEAVLGGVLMEQDRCAEALRHIERARALIEKFTPKNAPPNMGSQIALGRGQECMGDLSAARATFRQVVRQTEQSLGADHPEVIVGLVFEGRVAVNQRDPEAIPMMQRALEIQRRLGQSRSEGAIICHTTLAAALVQQQRAEEARRHAQEGIDILEELQSENPTRWAYSWLVLGRAEAQLGHHQEALRLFEQALKKVEGRFELMAMEIRLDLAWQLWRTGQDLPRVRELALKVYQEYAQNPRIPPVDRQDVTKLLETLGIAPPPVVRSEAGQSPDAGHERPAP
jgi:tetratricopeptide (TPR) repeat protein